MWGWTGSHPGSEKDWNHLLRENLSNDFDGDGNGNVAITTTGSNREARHLPSALAPYCVADPRTSTMTGHISGIEYQGLVLCAISQNARCVSQFFSLFYLAYRNLLVYPCVDWQYSCLPTLHQGGAGPAHHPASPDPSVNLEKKATQAWRGPRPGAFSTPSTWLNVHLKLLTCCNNARHPQPPSMTGTEKTEDRLMMMASAHQP